MKTVRGFQKAKSEGRPFSVSTCYDYWSACLLNKSDIDAILVGDSVAMVMHGHPSTLSADLEMMAMHTASVRRGAPDKFIVTDLPFPEHRKGIASGMTSIDKLMKAGCQAVKIEGIRGHADLIEHAVGSGIPVMGHLGLTPQSVNQFGGYLVQGKQQEAADALVEDALAVEAAGAFALVIECIPAALGEKISRLLKIPTIGIGSGAQCDGQVLVFQDFLGLNEDFKPKFVRNFIDGAALVKDAINRFHASVEAREFPSDKESF